jgi:enoyl-[acyl-carrier protein] reductase/trans-2-enoyl-CoA reductase (NAD+)
VKAFSGREGDEPPRVDFVDLEPGTPEEAISTIYVMGGGIVQTWIEALLAADLLAEGFQLLTVSYRGSDLNADVYRRGLIGLAKADLEFHTRALDHLLRERLGGRALAVEGPAVVTEASGGIPGVPFYMAVLMDVLGERFEDPLQSMMRLFGDRLGPEGPVTDAEGLVRLDDRELADDVQATMRARFDAATPGSEFPRAVYDAFMTAYARTRGFGLPGVDYAAEFDTDEICAS